MSATIPSPTPRALRRQKRSQREATANGPTPRELRLRHRQVKRDRDEQGCQLSPRKKSRYTPPQAQCDQQECKSAPSDDVVDPSKASVTRWMQIVRRMCAHPNHTPELFGRVISTTLEFRAEFPFHLTVDQAEIMIQAMPASKAWKCLMVACCEQPWNVDREVAMNGLCLFGNFGEPPSAHEVCEILLANLLDTTFSHRYKHRYFIEPVPNS
jgi:hypothetical protein